MLKTNAIVFIALFALSVSRNGDETMKTNKHLPDTPVFDGPYVLYRNDSVFVNYIEGDSVSASVKTASMLGDKPVPALARDTVFAVVMYLGHTTK